MPKIKPFKAVIYNQENIKKLAAVACPPYDVISPAQQEYYHELNPYNFIRIILGKHIPGEDKYRRSAAYFKDWLKNNIFVQEQKLAIYFYSQQYNVKGERKSRLGFIALLHLEDKNSSIFAHEHTKLAPKEDRLRLLKAVKANLSPIFVAFIDKERIIQRIYQQYLEDKNPFIDITDEYRVNHKVWRIDAPEIITKIQAALKDKNIFIADGHHRYEVACAFKEEMKKKTGSITGEEDFNYIMAYFTNAESRDLTIFPVHRLVKLNPKFNMDDFKASLSEYFVLEEVRDKASFFFLMEKGGRTENVLGMYKDRKYWLLRLKNIKILDKMIADKPKECRSLDVSILNSIILKKIMGVSLEENEDILYSPDAEQFIEKVDNAKGYIAFLLNPVKMQQVSAVAVTGNRMPPKSTYFYPKVLSGLVINKFGQEMTRRWLYSASPNIL